MTSSTSPDPEPPVSMRMHAQWWASKGIAVLPLQYPIEGPDGTLVCSCRDAACEKNQAKHPIFDRELGLRNGLNDATIDPDVVRTWWTKYPNANIGIRTGEVVDLIDMDSVEGFTTFMKLVEELGGMPEHFGVAMSGRDGFGQHVYVAPGGMKALAGGRTAPAGIDVKGRGGYAVAPPSRHISGARYRFTAQSFDEGALRGTVPWPEFYRRLEIRPTIAPRVPRSTTQIPLDAANAYGRAVLHRALSLVSSAIDGTRWQTMATEAIPLIARGIDGGCIDRDSAVRELEAAGRNVGLDPREVRRIGPLVDDMLAKGITNPISPKDAASQIADLIASPAGPLAAPHPAPRPTPTGQSNNGSGDSSDGAEDDSDDDSGAESGDPLVEPWEPPWPLRYPTPPFPTEVMGWMEPEILGLAEQLQCSVDLIAMMTLAAVAATVRGRIRAEFAPGWEEPLNLYIMAILGPGETKSPALGRILEPLREIERDAQSVAAEVISGKQWDKDFAEQRAKKLRETALNATTRDSQEQTMLAEEARNAAIAAEQINVPAPPLYLAGEMTPEALVSKMAEQGGALAHLSAEGALFDTIVGGRYSNGVAQLTGLLAAHDGREPILIHRKGAPDVKVEQPCLTIGLAIQPDVLQSLGGNEAAVGRGLAARFLYCIPSSLVGHRDMRRRRVGQRFDGFRELLRGVDRIASGEGWGHSADRPGPKGPISPEPCRVEPDEVLGISVQSDVDHDEASDLQEHGSGDFGPRSLGVSSEGSTSEAPQSPPCQGFGDFGPRSLKYVFSGSSSSLVDLFREDQEPRRAAETGDLGEIGPWANKIDGQLIRLAAVLQLVRDARPRPSLVGEQLPLGNGAQNPQTPNSQVRGGFGSQTHRTPNTQNPSGALGEVGVDAVADARTLVDYLIAHAVEAHALMSGRVGGATYARASQLLGWIKDGRHAEFTAHEAERSLRKRVTFRDQGSVRQACDTLCRLGWLRVVLPEPGKPGRPSLRFVVHPDALSSAE
jgi:hypothetical protein